MEQKWEGLLGSCMSSGGCTICIAPMLVRRLHTLKPSLRSSMRTGSESWRSWVSRTATATLTPTYTWAPELSLVGVSPPHRESLWGVCCSTLLQGPGNAGVSHFFPPYFYFWAGYRRSTTSLIFHCFPTYWFPASAASAPPASLPLMQKQGIKKACSRREATRYHRDNKNLCNKIVRLDT